MYQIMQMYDKGMALEFLFVTRVVSVGVKAECMLGDGKSISGKRPRKNVSSDVRQLCTTRKVHISYRSLCTLVKLTTQL